MATLTNKDHITQTENKLSDEDSQNPSVNPILQNQSNPTQNIIQQPQNPLHNHNPQTEPSSHPIPTPSTPPTDPNDTTNTETPDTQSLNCSDSPPNPCNNIATQPTQNNIDVIMKDLSNSDPNYTNPTQPTHLQNSKLEVNHDESESDEIDGYIEPDTTDLKNTHKRKLTEIDTDSDSQPPTKKPRTNHTARDIINIVAAMHTKNTKTKTKTKIMWNSPASKRTIHDSDTNDEDDDITHTLYDANESTKRHKIRPKKQLSKGKSSKSKRKSKKHKKKHVHVHKKSSKMVENDEEKVIIKVPKKERIPRLHTPKFKPTIPQPQPQPRDVNNTSPSTTSTNEDPSYKSSRASPHSYERERERNNYKNNYKYNYKYRDRERERERDRENNNLTGLWVQDEEVKFILYEDFKNGQIIGFVQFKQRTECTINGMRKENNYYDITQIFIHDRKHINQIAKLCDDYHTIQLKQVETNKTWTLKLESKRYPDDLFHELEQLKKAQQYGPYRYETPNFHGHGVPFGHHVRSYSHHRPPPYIHPPYPTSFITPYTHHNHNHPVHFQQYINREHRNSPKKEHKDTDKHTENKEKHNAHKKTENKDTDTAKDKVKVKKELIDVTESNSPMPPSISPPTSTQNKDKKSVIVPPDISPFTSPIITNANNIENANECIIITQFTEKKEKKHRRHHSNSKKKREKREKERRERRKRERQKEKEKKVKKERKRKQREFERELAKEKAMSEIFDAVSIEFEQFADKYLSKAKKFKSTIKKCSVRVQDRYKEKKSIYNVESAKMFLESNRNRVYIEKLVRKYVKQKDKHDKDKYDKQLQKNEDKNINVDEGRDNKEVSVMDLDVGVVDSNSKEEGKCMEDK